MLGSHKLQVRNAFLIALFSIIWAPLMAADITIVDGQTEIETQASAANGDTITIQTGGTIDTDGVLGVDINDDDATVNNAGTITVSDANAIDTNGANTTIINSGLISTTGTSAEGIRLSVGSVNSTITNNGTISTAGNGAEAIDVSGGATNAIVINNGSLTTMGTFAEGIFVAANSGRPTQNGKKNIGQLVGYGQQFWSRLDRT